MRTRASSRHVRKISSYQSPAWTTPDLHCQWDLMFLPFFFATPAEARSQFHSYVGTMEQMGIKWLAQGHNSKCQVVTQTHESWIGSTRPQPQHQAAFTRTHTHTHTHNTHTHTHSSRRQVLQTKMDLPSKPILVMYVTTTNAHMYVYITWLYVH